MEQELITKKELLEITGISYGALYRWKRMGLLPETWFLHRASFTGHETCLPRALALQRIADIQRMKETMTLEAILEQLQPGANHEISLSAAQVRKLGVALPGLVSQYLSEYPVSHFDFRELLGLYTFAQTLMQGRVSREEAFELSQAVKKAEDDRRVYLVRKYGVAICVTADQVEHIEFDPNASVAVELTVEEQKSDLLQLLRRQGVIE